MEFKEVYVSVSEVELWSTDTVVKWLHSRGFSLCEYYFLRNDIDGYTLVRLTEDDLRRPPVSMEKLGDIKRIIGAIDKLVPSRNRFRVDADCPIKLQSSVTSQSSNTEKFNSSSSYTESNRRRYSTNLKPEKFKMCVAACYSSAVMYLCAVIMTIVNERVPDMETYPPLPDLFLDILPFVPWAFHAAEYIALTLFAVFGFVVFTHKHRFIILRRYCSLVGTLFLLRGICMLITSLSVPCRTFQCYRYSDPDLYSKLKRAWDIVCCGGMALNGVRYCGDYMFSGHTTLLTLVSLFIDEYSDKRYPIVKTLCWILALFGIFFVMAGHEHYSIDVFIAFYLTTRLFLYYHTLADNNARLRYDTSRRKMWFPLFTYFESEADGSIPHEYDWPLGLPRFISKHLFRDREKTE
ncbi:sphingomyelin synthase-related protein 1-like [Watersipora subatra]|uniref:sphingomyelin synthase-related protein 1-like n=1 Tax=Watersipora subatra TaxID=2589382 RepID=UPI00355B5138